MEKKLFYDGKKIAKFEEKRIIVDKAFKTIKSAEIEKVILRTAESVAAFSEKRTCRITGKKLCYKVHNARFTLKSSTLPVQVRHVHLQHHIDIQKCSVEWKEKLYKYI